MGLVFEILLQFLSVLEELLSRFRGFYVVLLLFMIKRTGSYISQFVIMSRYFNFSKYDSHAIFNTSSQDLKQFYQTFLPNLAKVIQKESFRLIRISNRGYNFISNRTFHLELL